jgi:alpha-1,2-mannosyltransferase
VARRAFLSSLGRAVLALGPLLVLTAFVVVLGAVLASAGPTLGYDFEAYRRAGERVLAGEPLYDTSAAAAGPYGLFLYPPPFAVAMVPFALLPLDVARWTWIVMISLAFLVGTAILPLRPGVRWGIIGLGAVCLPLLYAIKLGQVSPLLYLLFAIAWRSVRSPVATGSSVAAGFLIKLQPGILFGWLFFRREGRALLVGLAIVAVAALGATLVVGVGAWRDYVDLLVRVSSPISTPRNMTFGAIAYRAGLDAQAASVIQASTVALTVLVTLFAWIRRGRTVGLLVGVVASQLVSPVLWDHYALFVLLPTALLLQRRQWWAAALPVLPWLGIDLLYPGVLAVAGLAVLASPGTDEDIPLIRAWPGTSGW